MSDNFVGMLGPQIMLHEALMMAQCIENNTIRPSILSVCGIKHDGKMGRMFATSFSTFVDVEDRIAAMFGKMQTATFFGVVSYDNPTGKTELKALPEVYLNVNGGTISTLHWSRFYKPEDFINGKTENSSSNIMWLPPKNIWDLLFSPGTSEKMAWSKVNNIHIVGDTDYWAYKWARSMSIFYPGKYAYSEDEQYSEAGIRYKVSVNDARPERIAREMNIVTIDLKRP